MKAFFRCCVCWLLPVVLGAASFASAQEHGQVFDPKDGLRILFDDFETYDAFWTLHRHLGCRPIANFDDFLISPPHNTLVVLLGDLSAENRLNRLMSEHLYWFWLQGGAVLVASGDKDGGLLRFWKLKIDGMVVRQGGIDLVDRLEANFPGPYGGFADCPLVMTSPSPPFEKLLGQDEMALATNGPSVLVPEDFSPLEAVAHFPNNCWTRDLRDGKKQKIPYAVEMRRSPPWQGKTGVTKGPNLARLQNAVYAMAAPARGDRGPILVMAGERLLGDRMLGFSDNYQFALGCRDFLLKDGREKPRQHMLFIVDGFVVIRSFLVPDDFEPPTPPTPPLPPITTDMIDGVLADVERGGGLRQMLTDLMTRQTGLKLLLGAGSLLLVLYLLYRLGKGRLRIDTKAPLVVDPQAADVSSTPTRSASEDSRRRAALLERGETLETLDNFAEAAQALARQWFWQNADIAPVQWDEPGFRFAGFSVAGTWWQRWTLGRELDRLRGMAQSSAQSLSGRAFRKLHVRLKELANLVDAQVIALAANR